MNFARRVLGGFFLLVLSSGFGWAQGVSTAQMSGVVKDATGAVLPGAEVDATQTDTGLKRTAISDETGSYTLTNLPVGPYKVEVMLPGFRTYVQTGIILQVNSNPVVNAVLEVGQVSEQVEVQADAALVETRQTGVGQVIDNQRVLELPLNGRQATELIFLAGIATPTTGAGLNSGVRNYPTVEISVAGVQSGGIAYMLDGASHNDPYNNLNLPLPFPDALQEFKVETSALPAQYGHHASAAVNGVTKSGTNEFHGDAFEFLRNTSLNARNAFVLTGDGLKRNQFGGTIGGPIKRDKVFFFLGEQTTFLRSAPATAAPSFVPTAAMLNGDFTAITAASCNTSGKPITLTGPFVGNKVDTKLFSPAAMKILTNPAMPTTSDPCGQIRFGRKVNSNEYNSLGRIDYQITSKHTLFGRYLQAHLDQQSDFDSKNLLALVNAALPFWVHTLVVGDTYVLGSGTVNNFRATLNRSKIDKSSPAFFDATDLGINMWVAQPKFMRFSITNGFNIAGTSATPSNYDTTSFQLVEDVSLIRGKHQIGVGIDWVHGELNGVSKLNATGPFTFNGQVYGLGLADFMLGKPSALTQGSPSLGYYRLNYVGLYAQDAWKATPHLTLTGGVRWDPNFGVHANKNGYIPHFDPNLFTSDFHSSVYVKAPAGLIFPGDAGYPGLKVMHSDLMNIAPRVGLAWDPKGDGRLSVRAGYGIFYDLLSLNNYIGLAQAPPFGNNVTLNFPASFENPWQGQLGGNPFPASISSTSPFVNFGGFENFIFDPKTEYSQQWNLSVQRQIGQDWLIAGNYIGTESVHLWDGDQANPASYIPGTCTAGQYGLTAAGACSSTTNTNFRRALYLQNPAQGQYFGSISQLDPNGTGNYNALLLSVQHRARNGLTIQGNYTWAHCISDLTNPELGVAGANYIIAHNRLTSRGNCPTADRRQNFNLSTVYQTPKFNGAALRTVASGWQISGIVRLTTGQYLSVTSGVDQALTGQGGQLAAQILGDPYSSNKTVDHYLNPLAFTQPTLGTYSTMRPNNVLGPGMITINMGLTRTFKIREAQSMQFRAEAFNVPNHMNPGNPITAFNNTNFGKIQTANDPRIMQFALKYVF
jgi:carboxypeptidase family protein